MDIIHSDRVFRVNPNETPNYKRDNPLLKLVDLVQRTDFAAEREHYLPDSIQFLTPFRELEVYGPQKPDSDVLDPRQQDSKTDFQKQNVRDFLTTDTMLSRGLVTAGDWTGPFIRVSYRGGPDSQLSQLASHKVGGAVLLWIKVNGVTSSKPVRVPYNPRTDRYDVELWGYPGDNLRSLLDEKGAAAMDAGTLAVRTDLLHGSARSFEREGRDGVLMVDVDPMNSMHPILPLSVELAWGTETGEFWDSQGGKNYKYQFNMVVRGWDHYLEVGASANPHGGVGFLEYRNLLSNYGSKDKGRNELGRTLQPWNFDANGSKDRSAPRRESFMAVDYMDLHVLKGSCGIGLHRHRDNQEAFFMVEGRGLMVVGDWCKFPERERCFEVRTLRSGHLAMLKGGNLHGLLNTTDENISLFMFGGYD